MIEIVEKKKKKRKNETRINHIFLRDGSLKTVSEIWSQHAKSIEFDAIWWCFSLTILYGLLYLTIFLCSKRDRLRQIVKKDCYERPKSRAKESSW